MKIEHEILVKEGKMKVVELTRKSAIFHFCQECVCFVPSEVDLCTSKNCALYPFRNAKAIREYSTRKANPKAIKALAKARRREKKK